MKLRHLVFLVFCFCTVYGFSQNVEEIIDGNIYQAKVKLVDEFIDRFNLVEHRTDIDSLENNPFNNLLLLFNLDMFPSQEDSTYLEAEKFIQFIIDNKIKINHDDGSWYARLQTNIKLNGKPNQCFLYLNFVPREGEDMYRWQIVGVEGELFSPTPIVPDLFINPVAHEMEFMELKRVTKEAYKYIDSYFSTDFKYNSLSAFSFAVSNGLLKIESVENIDFVFEQVPGYRFFIAYFPRETQNSGWLIHKLEKR